MGERTESLIEFGKRHQGQKIVIELARRAHRNAVMAYHEGRHVNEQRFNRTIDYTIKAAQAHRVLVAAGGAL